MKGTGGEYFGGLVNQRVWRLVGVTYRRVKEKFLFFGRQDQTDPQNVNSTQLK